MTHICVTRPGSNKLFAHRVLYERQAAILKVTSLKINRLMPMATINMHMKFEIEIPKETWLMLRKPRRLQTDGRTNGQTDGRADGQGESSIPPPPPSNFVGRGYKDKTDDVIESWKMFKLMQIRLLYIYKHDVMTCLLSFGKVKVAIPRISSLASWVPSTKETIIAIANTLETHRCKLKSIAHLCSVFHLVWYTHDGLGKYFLWTIHKQHTQVPLYWSAVNKLGEWLSLCLLSVSIRSHFDGMEKRQ